MGSSAYLKAIVPMVVDSYPSGRLNSTDPKTVQNIIDCPSVWAGANALVMPAVVMLTMAVAALASMVAF